MFGGGSVGLVVYSRPGCGGVGGGGLGLLPMVGVVIGFTYGCGACHAGFAAVWVAFGGLGVVVL